MFTDIVNYTHLMGEDEQRAFEVLKSNNKIHQYIIRQYGGRFIKELGDGVLATFSSATDAVLAAVAIQTEARDVPDLHLRVGIHLSEVVFENDDVYGDGVNIAARIQTAAPVNGIYISEFVQKNIANKKGITTELRGDVELKHVRDLVRIYEVIITDDSIEAGHRAGSDLPLNAKQEKSIAVLPFRNLDPDPEQAYLGEGVAEEILITLSNVQGLKVVGRRSSFIFKGSEMPIQEIGKQLNVGVVLDGSIRKHGTGIRINAELISVETGHQLWAERYDREMTDIFHIQDDIASKISERFKVTYLEEENRIPPVNMEAYELLLKGRSYVEKFLEGFEKALACFTRAIEIEPDYAEAYAELAKLHFLFTMQLFYPPREGFERARFYAEKALLLNSELGSAHYVLGQIYFWYDWDFEKSKKQYELAEDANVSYYFSGVVIDPWYPAFAYGDFDKAIASIMKILETDPMSFYAQLHLAYFYTWGRRPANAREVINQILRVVPNFSEGERLLAYNSLLEGDSKQAVYHGERASEMAHGMGWSQITLAIAYAQNGQQDEAFTLLKKIESSTQGPLIVSPLGIGLVHAYLGDTDKAFEFLNKALEFKDIWMVSMKYGPEYAPLRLDPRFDAILDQIGFPE